MRLIGDHEIEEADVEVFVVVDQALVDADVDAGVELADVIGLTNDVQRFVQEVVERVLGLLAQFLAIAEEEHTLGPARFDQELRQRDGHACLPRAGGLHDEGFAMSSREALSHAGDRLDLVETPGNHWIGTDLRQI
jgi:hypothetical protein